MALDYNKRLRYFATEAEYEVFVEQQREAADAGELDLYETTVCCITHGDVSKPDTYLPSHDVGDEDIIMHYNADDDIRYVPFINPMWLMKLCVIYPIDGGFKPVLREDVSLSDVVDGQQLTRLDNDFWGHIMSMPRFSVKNIEYVSYSFALRTPKHTSAMSAPSVWPSLKTINATTSYNSSYLYNLPNVRFLKFGDDNVINAPNLEVFNFGYFSKDNMNPEPVIVSSKLREVHYLFSEENGVVNLSDYIPDTTSLEIIYGASGEVKGSSAYASYDVKPIYPYKITFNYNGPGLTINRIVLRSNLASGDNGVFATFTGSGDDVFYNYLYIYNANLSNSNLTKLSYTEKSCTSFIGCYVDDASSGSMLDFISWSENDLHLNATRAYGRYMCFGECLFNNYYITLNLSTPTLKIGPNRNGGICDVTIANSQWSGGGINLTKYGDYSFDEIRIHLLPDGPRDQYGGWGEYDVSTITANCTKISFDGGKLYSGGESRSVLNSKYSMDGMYDMYVVSDRINGGIILETTVNINILKHFIVHIARPKIIFNSHLDEVHLVIENSADTYGRPGYTPPSSNPGYINITLVSGASVGTYDIKFDSSVTYIKEFFFTCIDKNIQQSEVEKIINVFGAQVYASGLSISSSRIDIHRIYYDSLSQSALDVVGQFVTINIYEDEVS